jgi:hypothetical protein
LLLALEMKLRAFAPQMQAPDDVQKPHVDHSVAPIAQRSGRKFKWLNSQWNLPAFTDQFQTEINSPALYSAQETDRF